MLLAYTEKFYLQECLYHSELVNDPGCMLSAHHLFLPAIPQDLECFSDMFGLFSLSGDTVQLSRGTLYTAEG